MGKQKNILVIDDEEIVRVSCQKNIRLCVLSY